MQRSPATGIALKRARNGFKRIGIRRQPKKLRMLIEPGSKHVRRRNPAIEDHQCRAGHLHQLFVSDCTHRFFPPLIPLLAQRGLEEAEHYS